MDQFQYSVKQRPAQAAQLQSTPGVGGGPPQNGQGQAGTGSDELKEGVGSFYAGQPASNGSLGGSSNSPVGFTGQRQPVEAIPTAGLEIFDVGNEERYSRMDADSLGALNHAGRGASSATSSRRSSGSRPGTAFPRSSGIDFPVLPPSELQPHQTFQTPHQVQSILSLPTSLLLNLARTKDLSEQVQIAASASATSYLPSMSLPPPPSDHLVRSISGQQNQVVTKISDHPAIPILLGQAFSPPTPGIAAQSNPVAKKQFELIYSSVEDWSLKMAREQLAREKALKAQHASDLTGPSRPSLPTTHSFNEREIKSMASQLKTWALKEQDKQVHEQVVSSKEAAVLLATHAAARMNVVEAVSAGATHDSSRPGLPLTSSIAVGGPNDPSDIEAAVQGMDLTPYAEQYRIQLDAIASGYFSQLHREALNRLLSAAETPSPFLLSPRHEGTFPSSQPPSTQFNQQMVGTPQLKAMYVQAAAAAAIASNALAANEILSLARDKITTLGFDAQALLPARSPKGLSSLELPPDALVSRHPSPQPNKNQPLPPPNPNPSTILAPPEVAAFIAHGTSSNCSPQTRDYLLSYAHALYARDPSSQDLIALLHTLETVHPTHLPTLLLLSCVYYTRGELESSLFYNQRLLQYDSNYVEAYSNIGTTLRAMGKWQEAEQYWWRAIKLRPTYWDATENLLGVLCNPGTTNSTSTSGDPIPTSPRYQEALALCEYVEVQIYANESIEAGDRTPAQLFGDPLSTLPRPRCIPACVPPSHIQRLQNLFYAKGNLRLALGDRAGSQDEYEKAVECVLSLPAWTRGLQPKSNYPSQGASLRDLIIVTVVLGQVLAAKARAGGDWRAKVVQDALERFGLLDAERRIRFDSLLQDVQNGGDAYAAGFIGAGGGVLPTVLLAPDSVALLPAILFPSTNGQLPSLLERYPTDPNLPEVVASRKQTVQATNQTTSTMLLTLAKTLQDAMAIPGGSASLGGIPVSASLLLPLYYISLAFFPSPSTCNNLGILLSTLNSTALIAVTPGHPPVEVSGQQLALLYYKAGLEQDSRHPHLFTNLGSLLKDMGQLNKAVAMYRQAVEFNPTFDVALANLANAIKDIGQVQESIPYYRRAVQVNPNFPEAICGLVNALGGVCDWMGRGGVGDDWTVDNTGNISPPVPSPPGVVRRSGYLGQISELVNKQLKEGQTYGIGSVRASGSLERWLDTISYSIYDIPASELGPLAEAWKERLELFFTDYDSNRPPVNEGGFVIRLIERLTRRIQRRWYLTVYGRTLETSGSTFPRIHLSPGDLQLYRRPLLPPSLPAIAVPTVLPFHTFSYPVTPREIRLISHRTGLRISHNTLNQPWLPTTVYPPPPPPLNGRLNIGYVSSDFGNHPLSHLMQSVFGLHNQDSYNVFCYATSPSDQSTYRIKIETEAHHFLDVSAWSTQQIVERVVLDEIHVLVNLSGYTKGARNEIFAARPAPVQMSYMGFAGTLAAGWCDYFIVDPVVCPPSLVSGHEWRLKNGYLDSSEASQVVGDELTDFEGDPDPEGPSETFVYTEKLIYMPHSYFVTDHKQAWREDASTGLLPGEIALLDDGSDETRWAIEEDKRWRMRKRIFPHIRDDTFIFANFNQLYKIDPFIFRVWLNILTKFPNSILWLLRFPSPGEQHLKEIATKWAGPEVAARIIFTDVASKSDHIYRGRVADLFLDTTEVNAHTTAADSFWGGTPVLTYPRYLHKMCSRVAASIALATGFGDELIVGSAEEYEARALSWATGLSYEIIPARVGAFPNEIDGRSHRRGRGDLIELRKKLWMTRDNSPLFDTARWVRNAERGFRTAWERWVDGTEFEDTSEWAESQGEARNSGCVWIEDERDGRNLEEKTRWMVPES